METREDEEQGQQINRVEWKKKFKERLEKRKMESVVPDYTSSSDKDREDRSGKVDGVKEKAENGAIRAKKGLNLDNF